MHNHCNHHNHHLNHYHDKENNGGDDDRGIFLFYFIYTLLMFIYMDFLFYYNCDDDREKMGGDTGREKGGATTTGGGQGPRYIHFSYLFITLLTTIYRPLYTESTGFSYILQRRKGRMEQTFLKIISVKDVLKEYVAMIQFQYR